MHKTEINLIHTPNKLRLESSLNLIELSFKVIKMNHNLESFYTCKYCKESHTTLNHVYGSYHNWPLVLYIVVLFWSVLLK